MPLDKYLKCWDGGAVKMIFPYSLFQTVEEMCECTEFPTIEEFKRDKEIDTEIYEKCKKLFESRMSLPTEHPDRWSSFVDYLKFYNLSDVHPTSIAMMNQFSIFEKNFGLSPYQCMGLPQFAKKSMYKMYDQFAPAIFSFSENSSATQVFREQTIGGLVNVYKRHVTLDQNEQAPAAAKQNKNGNYFQIFIFIIIKFYVV